MSVSFEGCRALMAAFEAKYGTPIKRWEVSSTTLREIESKLPPLIPTNNTADYLWGIPFTVDESVPDGEVKPIYA